MQEKIKYSILHSSTNYTYYARYYVYDNINKFDIIHIYIVCARKSQISIQANYFILLLQSL